ncbi:DNA primase small subunit [Anas platyrhynchos]|uniref:DNA primase AEP n=1 Tax=Anas platyrhynchos TaxID=8839 RepID=R0L691_ANAPL|nr:DNA primase small subunit [Anas platyrhynchos]
MTDYDDCHPCQHAPAARLFLPAEDLGMKHRLWVYSGRRGVHCWVCDDAVRKWSPALRAAAVEYLTLVKVGVWGPGSPARTHPG